MKRDFTIDAVRALVGPEARIVLSGEGLEGIAVQGARKPTKAAFAKKLAELEAQAELEGVRQARAGEYPALADQLDALWHAMDAGTLPKVEGFYDAIAAVKAKHPKP